MPSVAKWIGTVGGIGLIPWLPGTWASLVSCGVAWWLHPYPWALWLFAGVIMLAGLWVTRPCQALFQANDPSQVVIDELAGMALVTLWLPHQLLWFGLAFVLFRLIDIFKPFPVNAMQERLGWYGVMLDDLGAGGYAAIVIQIILHWT